MSPPRSSPEPELQAARDDPGRTTSSSILRGGAWSAISRVVPQVQLLALSVIAARYLGPDGLGRQSYIAFVALSLVLVATAGLPAALSRFAAEMLGAGAPGAARSLLRWTARIEVPAAAVAAAVPVVAAAAGAGPTGAWVLAGIGAGLAVLQATPAALLLGAQRWRDATLPGLVTGVASVPATIAVLEAGGGITGVFAVETGVLAANLAWTSILARRVVARLGPPAAVDPEVRGRFLHVAGLATVIVAIEFVVWRRSELFVMDRVSTDAQIALYSIAFATVWGLARIPGAIAKVVTPAVATLVGAGDLARVRTGFWRAARLLLLTTPPLAAMTAALGPEALRLAYGSAFDGVGAVLLVLAIPLSVLPLLTTSAAVLFGLGRVRFLAGAGLAATVVDIGLAVALIPALDAVGAAIANSASQLTAGIPAFVLTCRLLGPVDLAAAEVAGGLVAAAAGGAAAALAVVALGGAAGAATGLALGTAVWALAIAAVRPMRSADAVWFAGALGPAAAVRSGRALALATSRR